MIKVTNITYAVDDEWRRIATDTANALKEVIHTGVSDAK